MQEKGRTAKRAGGFAALLSGLALYSYSLGGIASIDGTLATAGKPDRPVTVTVAGERDCPHADDRV
jgi:hypothetical protein